MRLTFLCPTNGCGRPMVVEARHIGSSRICENCKAVIRLVNLAFGRDDQYRLDDCISVMGMGLVLVGRDTLERQIVLKVPILDRDPDQILERFRTEIKAIRRLKHGNICEIQDSGEWLDNAYYTMPFLPGGTLSDRIRNGSPLPIAEVVEWIYSAARAMSYSHRFGVVHRDLKPANMMFDERGVLKVTDFGLALLIEDREATRMTNPGALLGTLSYAPPEQIAGETTLHGPPCDIYALGVILYEALTGRRPFIASGKALEAAILAGKKPRPRELRGEIAGKLERICLAAMHPVIEYRYDSMEEFVDDLEDYRRRASPGHPVEIGPLEGTFRAGRLGVEMTLIPSGEFVMGSAEEVDERPRRRVKFASPFHLGVHPVTEELYVKVIGQLPQEHRKTGDRRPVGTVTWLDAIGFCNLLSAVDDLSPYYRIDERGRVERIGGHGYRLPTEAEWEYACRAGSEDHYCFGDDRARLDEFAWYVNNSKDGPRDVGLLKANAFGLHDMHGNIWEWCWDWYHPDGHKHRRESDVDKGGVPSGRHRVLRGGAWGSEAQALRSATRQDFVPDELPLHYNGFRIARSP